jgi:hypothetical protein
MMSEPQTEIILFKGKILCEETGGPVPGGVQVSARFGGVVYPSSVQSDSDGTITLSIRDSSKIKDLEKKRTVPIAYDLYFCQPLSSSSRGNRPTVYNRQGLYCEGRKLDWNTASSQIEETRLIRTVFNASRIPIALASKLDLLCMETARDLKRISVCVVTGMPGVGKTSFLATLFGLMQLTGDFENIVCHSFEFDSSSNFFEMTMRNLGRSGNPKEANIRKELRDMLGGIGPSIFLFDGIDEASNSELDRGWGAVLKDLVHQFINGIPSRNGQVHRLVVSSRSFPKFLKNQKANLIHRELIDPSKP